VNSAYCARPALTAEIYGCTLSLRNHATSIDCSVDNLPTTEVRTLVYSYMHRYVGMGRRLIVCNQKNSVQSASNYRLATWLRGSHCGHNLVWPTQDAFMTRRLEVLMVLY